MTDIRVSITNDSDVGGIFQTPFWLGFHDNSFDLYNLGEASSAGLEQLAEDGNAAGLGAELLTADADGQGFVVTGAGGPVATRETTSQIFDIDPLSNGFLSLAAMLLPSNDAFIGTANALQIFDENGEFLGPQEIDFNAANVRDAGTEVNTELDAAFLNQTAPNTGITENGVITVHPGFNGSAGNPVGEGDALVLGRTNAAGAFIDPSVADFTLPENDDIATVHINTVNRLDAGGASDRIHTGDADDIIDGGAGNDAIFAGNGWDEIDGGVGNDLLFGDAGNDIVRGGEGDDRVFGGEGNDEVFGGIGNDVVRGDAGNDLLDGGEGDDRAFAGDGNDIVNGGAGNDRAFGGEGNDAINGGAGDDRLFGENGDDLILGGEGDDLLLGGEGNDVFVFNAGDGNDRIRDFSAGDDTLALNIEGIETFEDVLANATDQGGAVRLDFGDAGQVALFGTEIDDLTVTDFTFG